MSPLSQTFRQKNLQKSFHPTVQPYCATFFCNIVEDLASKNSKHMKNFQTCRAKFCIIFTFFSPKSSKKWPFFTNYHKIFHPTVQIFSKTSQNLPIFSNFLSKPIATLEKFLPHCLDSTWPNEGQVLTSGEGNPFKFHKLSAKIECYFRFFLSPTVDAALSCNCARQTLCQNLSKIGSCVQQ